MDTEADFCLSIDALATAGVVYSSAEKLSLSLSATISL
jgi:hypothetical protein